MPHDIGRQIFLVRLVFPKQYDRLGDVGVPGENRFDLTQFDAEPAELHLVIEPAQELEVPVGPPADEVPRPI
jgi:hypothetical protein